MGDGRDQERWDIGEDRGVSHGCSGNDLHVIFPLLIATLFMYGIQLWRVASYTRY